MSLLPVVNARGVLASRPAAAASNEGYNYFGTDTGVLYRSNGSSWDTNSAGFTNPMTTAGDTIYGGASGLPTRKAGGSDGQAFIYRTGTPAPAWETQHSAFEFVIDGGGATITTGVKGDLRVPFACEIVRASLLADASGSIVVDIWVDTYANYPPTVADTITASAKPTISSATKAEDATLTGWTKTLAEGSTIRLNVDSATTIQRVTLELKVKRT